MPEILPAANRAREWRFASSRMDGGIHASTRPRYPDGTVTSEPVTPERRRFAIRLPRPLGIGVAAV